MKPMDAIIATSLAADEAGLWFLGQAGFILRSAGVTVAIDPYLSDSAAAAAPEFTRQFPPPIQPEELCVDLYVITHDHLDHLDPETLAHYRHKSTTTFVGPRQVCRRLAQEFGIPSAKLAQVDVGAQLAVASVSVTGVFTLPTGPDVLDTTGYLLAFDNGRTFYHASDTQMTPLLLASAPRGVDVLTVPINGKWGNLDAHEAAELAAAVAPRFVFPNHFDMMALNSENPETFCWLCKNRDLTSQCLVPKLLQPFIWK